MHTSCEHTFRKIVVAAVAAAAAAIRTAARMIVLRCGTLLARKPNWVVFIVRVGVGGTILLFTPHERQHTDNEHTVVLCCTAQQQNSNVLPKAVERASSFQHLMQCHPFATHTCAVHQSAVCYCPALCAAVCVTLIVCQLSYYYILDRATLPV